MDESDSNADGMTEKERQEWRDGVRRGEQFLPKQIAVCNKVLAWIESEKRTQGDAWHADDYEGLRQDCLKQRAWWQWNLDHWLYKTPKERAELWAEQQRAGDPDFQQPSEAEMAELQSKVRELNELDKRN